MCVWQNSSIKYSLGNWQSSGARDVYAASFVVINNIIPQGIARPAGIAFYFLR